MAIPDVLGYGFALACTAAIVGITILIFRFRRRARKNAAEIVRADLQKRGLVLVKVKTAPYFPQLKYQTPVLDVKFRNAEGIELWARCRVRTGPYPGIGWIDSLIDSREDEA